MVGQQRGFEWSNGRIVEVPVEGDRADAGAEVVHTVAWAFLRPGLRDGLWIGRTAAGGCVGGWAPGASHVTVRRDGLVHFETDVDPVERHLAALALTGIGAALDRRDLTTKVGAVVGAPPLCTLVQSTLTARGMDCSAGWPQAEKADVIFDTGPNLDDFIARGSALRSGTTYVKLIEPGLAPVDIDVYPNIHKKSLRFRCVPLLAPGRVVSRAADEPAAAVLEQVFTDRFENAGTKWLLHRAGSNVCTS